MIRIGVDARELCGHVTGAGRYLAGLVREWSRTPHELVLYGHETPSIAFDPRRITSRHVAGAPGTWWEQVRLPRVAAADHLDVFFAPAYTAPVRLAVPIVLAIHDVSFAAHPEWFRLREGLRRRWLTRRSAARARAVITISEFSRSEIAEHLGVPIDQVRVIPPGIDRPAARTPPAQSADAPRGRPRVLYVGSLFNRRHVPDLIRAVARVRRSHPDVQLDIVGDDRTCPPEPISSLIAHAGLDGSALWHQYLSGEALAELFQQARAFAFLSEYEGLGLTPLEALAAGVPPVVADTPVAHEAYGPAALYVPVGDVAAAAAALERALFDETTRALVLEAAPWVLARYDWRRAAADTMAVIEEAARSA